MIRSAEAKASAVLEASKLISESLAGLTTICDMCIDNKGNIQCKDNRGNWTTIISLSTISSIKTRGSDGEYQNYAIKDNISRYLDMSGLQIYDKKIKEYIDKRIDEKLSKMADSTYKVIMGESDEIHFLLFILFKNSLTSLKNFAIM